MQSWEEAKDQGNYARAATLLSAAIEDCLDAAERLARLMALGQLQERDLDDQDAASGSYLRVLEIDYSHAPALQALERIYDAQAKWSKLADLLQLRADLCEDPHELTQVLLQLARLNEENLDNVSRALSTYRRVLDVDPSNTSAQAAVERLSS